MIFNMKRFPLNIASFVVIIFVTLISNASALDFAFEGNRTFTESQLRQAIAFSDEAPPDDSLKSVLEQIAILYQSAGYFDSSIEVDSTFIDRTDSAYRIKIDEQRQYTFGDIKFDGLRIYSRDNLLAQVGQLSGAPATTENLNRYIKLLLDTYAEFGYPYVTIEVRGITPDNVNYTAEVTLFINEGPPVKIDTVLISGNSVTADRVIRREIQLLPGALFSRSELDNSVRRIKSLRFVTTTQQPLLYFSGQPKKGVVVFHVEERKTSTVNGVLGYVPSTGARQEYLSGSLDIILDNIMGTGRRGEIHYRSPNPDSREVNFSYTEPYFLGTPLDWTLDFNQIDRDSSFVKISAQLSLRYRLSPATDLRFQASMERTTPGKADLFPEERFSGYSLSIGLQGDYFDYSDNPHEGYSFSAFVRYHKRIYSPYDDYIPPEPEVNRTAGELESSWAFPLTGRTLVFFTGGAAAITPSDRYLPVSERYNIGGSSTVRGYLEGRYYGSAIGYLRSEYRLLSGRDGRIYLFGDNGYYYFKNKMNQDVDDFLHGYGLGFAAKTRLGLLIAEFAWGESDSFSDGKFHFGLENNF
ncbi:MAG: BamA/TamA family outer membrane protein [candidate division Zixibacteria bacterium]|nr:BamA/TamA family outer membrane protein [candidate division Zixibacteria bacterium]